MVNSYNIKEYNKFKKLLEIFINQVKENFELISQGGGGRKSKSSSPNSKDNTYNQQISQYRDYSVGEVIVGLDINKEFWVKKRCMIHWIGTWINVKCLWNEENELSRLKISYKDYSFYEEDIKNLELYNEKDANKKLISFFDLFSHIYTLQNNLEKLKEYKLQTLNIITLTNFLIHKDNLL